MKEFLNVALVQSDLVWENPLKNRTVFQGKILELDSDVDLIILPEMFTTGFTMNAAAVAETMEGETVRWMQKIAQAKEAAVTGSVVIKEGGKYYNRMLFATPDGSLDYYDKKHTFTLAGEHHIYTSGKQQKLIMYNGWKLCLLICYDLRFPVWARNIWDYDVLIYVANWPKPRIAAWDALLKARSIENMCYGIGVNRVGLDGKNHNYPGHSGVYDVLGNCLAFSKTETILYAVLRKDHLRENREKFRFLDDKDKFVLM